MRIGLSRPRALATSLAGLLTQGLIADFTSSRKFPVTCVKPLTHYSCGRSRGFPPHSHIHAQLRTTNKAADKEERG